MQFLMVVLLTEISTLHTDRVIGPFKGTIGMYMASPWSPPSTSKLMNFLIFGLFWVRMALGNMLTSIVSNSHFGKRLVARDMTIFGCHVGRRVSENVNSADFFIPRPPGHLRS